MHFKAMKYLSVLFGILALLHAFPLGYFVTQGDSSQGGLTGMMAVTSLGNISELSETEAKRLAVVLLGLNLLTVILVILTA